MQYAKENSAKQRPASLSDIPFCSFIEENKQKKKKSEENFRFFQTFNGKNHTTI